MSPEQVSSHKTLSGLVVRRWRDEFGHEWDTILNGPPKACPTCRDARFARETEEAERRRAILQNRRSATERAENAHAYHSAHWICQFCVLSRSSDAHMLTEAHASMFSQRKLRGFKRGAA